MKTKICTKCKEKKDITEFYTLDYWCKKCSYKYNRRWSQNNPEKVKESRRKYYQKHKEEIKTKRRQKISKNKEWFAVYKKTLKCEICGESRWYCLVFHHKNPEEKEYNIGSMINRICNKEKILEEIEKCIILCANCHRELHYNLKIRREYGSKS